MCDLSRWKRRAYCYSTKKIKSATSSKWERQIPKEEDYWNEFCQKQESKVIVRKSCQNLIHFPVNYEYPLDLRYGVSNNGDTRSIVDKIDQLIRERRPHAKSKFNVPSFELESFSLENDIDSLAESASSAITVMSSTLPETPTKTFNVRERGFESVIAENISFGAELSSQSFINDQNAISEDIRSRKIYSKRNCPFHRNEPLPRIFDDDIEKYLIDSNRRGKDNVDDKMASRKDGELFVKKSCKLCNKKFENCTLKSTEKLMNDVKLSTDLNSSRANSKLASRNLILDATKNEGILETVVNEVDNIKLSCDPHSNRGNLRLGTQIPKLAGANLKGESNKLMFEDVDNHCIISNLRAMTQDKNLLTIPNLSERKYRSIPKNRSPKLNVKLQKYMNKRKKSSDDSDFQKYSLRYAYKALKCVTRNKNLCFDPKTFGTRNETSRNSVKDEQQSVNVPTSIRSIASLDLDVTDRLKDRTNSSDNFLNRLPKLSYFPRRSHDRCLSCLYKSVDKLAESEEKNICNMTKRRTPMQNVSIDSDNSDVTLPDLDQCQVDNCETATKYDIFMNKKQYGSADTQDIKEPAKLPEKTLLDGVEEAEQRPIDLKLELRTSEDKRIEFQQVSGLSERSKPSSSCSSPDEDKSSVVYLEDNSKTSKYRVPCHVPTVFCPTLEPLKALKAKKSTSLQSRVASDESTIVAAVETRDNIKLTTSETKQPEKLAPKDSKSETDSIPRKKILAKVKSVSENLIAESDDTTKEKKGILRRGSSCVNLETILRDFAKDRRLESLIEDDHDKSSDSKFLFSTEEIDKVLKDLEERNSSTIDTLATLCDMFLNRVLESSNMDRKRIRLIKRLVKLLVDSRRYLYPNKYPSDLIFSSQFLNQRPVLNAARLRNILPQDSYNLIAPLLGIPEYYSRQPYPSHTKQCLIEPVEILISDKSDLSQETRDDLIVHPPSAKVDTVKHHELQTTLCNPYARFLKRERRKAVTWRPLQEEDLKGYDPDATLRMRADKVTMEICRDFCDWLRSLGGAERDVDETVLKDMFEISFSADACKATQISVKEMATVPTDVAAARLCHGASVLEMTRKQLHRDAKAEYKPKCVLAFNTSVPIDLLFIPPNNRVREKWLECKNVPRDLETMDTVWSGIKNLDSVKGFLKWLDNYPEVKPPEALIGETLIKRRYTKFARKKSRISGSPKIEEMNVKIQENSTATQTA